MQQVQEADRGVKDRTFMKDQLVMGNIGIIFIG